jgi:hypothetical protein
MRGGAHAKGGGPRHAEEKAGISEKALAMVSADLDMEMEQGRGYSERVPWQDRGSHRLC